MWKAANTSAGMLQLGKLALTPNELSGAAVPHGGGMLTVAGATVARVCVQVAGLARQIQARSAAQYLTQHRTRGLETPAVGADIKAAEMAVKGRSGRAAGYMDEPAARLMETLLQNPWTDSLLTVGTVRSLPAYQANLLGRRVLMVSIVPLDQLLMAPCCPASGDKLRRADIPWFCCTRPSTNSAQRRQLIRI